MFAWLSENLINLALVGLILAAVLLALRSMVKNKNKCSCGCDCGSCGGCCHTDHRCTKS